MANTPLGFLRVLFDWKLCFACSACGSRSCHGYHMGMSSTVWPRKGIYCHNVLWERKAGYCQSGSTPPHSLFPHLPVYWGSCHKLVIAISQLRCGICRLQCADSPVPDWCHVPTSLIGCKTGSALCELRWFSGQGSSSPLTRTFAGSKPLPATSP